MADKEEIETVEVDGSTEPEATPCSGSSSNSFATMNAMS